MFERKDFEINSVQITGLQYLTLQALLKAASKEIDRFAITRVFYDHDRDQFVATNGHILRIEKLQWLEDAPLNSFFLSKRDLMLTAAQLMLKYAAEQGAVDVEEILVEIEYRRYEEYQEHPYPNYANVLPKAEARRPLEWIGMSPALLASMNKTFHVLPLGIRYQFHGPLAAVAMFDSQASGEEVQLLGVIMPVTVHGEAPPPLFELKEIERKAPEEEADDGVPAEQESLLDKSTGEVVAAKE